MGTLALSPRYLCFYRRHRLTGLSDTRVKIPVGDINKAIPTKAFRWHHYGLRVQIHAHKDAVFEFHQKSHRDESMKLIQDAVTRSKEKNTAKSTVGKAKWFNKTRSCTSITSGTCNSDCISRNN